MFDLQPLTVMLSSRCMDEFPYQGKPQPLSVLREAIRDAIRGIRFGGKPVFEVWIHEDDPGGHSWERCMERAKECDILLALYNGNGGWSGTNGSTARLGDHVGICHAELDEAMHTTRNKVRCIRLLPLVPAEPGSPNERFQQYMDLRNLNSAQVTTGEDAIKRAKEAVVAALLELARQGIGSGTKGGFYTDQALEWARMDFHQRRTTTTEVVAGLLQKRFGGKTLEDHVVVCRLAGVEVAFKCDSVPSSMGTAAARELVGQPFLSDWNTSGLLPKDVAGPVHVVACQKGVTESQALRQLGFPDAVVVSAPFGVYVADRIQCIQMVFIANCRDETTTRTRAQTFLMWLQEQGEEAQLVRRAISRRKISDLMASQWESRS